MEACVFTLISGVEIALGHAAADLKSDGSHVSNMREVRHRYRFCKHVEGTGATAEQHARVNQCSTALCDPITTTTRWLGRVAAGTSSLS